MNRQGWLTWLVGLCLLGGASTTRAGVDSATVLATDLRPPTPLEDDAQLHDIRFVGSRTGWAVGEHGVIWYTRDGGGTWSLQRSGVTCALNSLCFITDKVGWVAGGGTAPNTHLPYGVLLFTSDGGTSWQPLFDALEKQDARSRATTRSRTAEVTLRSELPATAAQSGSGKTPARSPMQADTGEKKLEPAANGPHLPRLYGVRFFSLEQGFVVGQATAEHPTGVLFTEDGGRSWRDLPGKAAAGWRTADFLNPEQGAVAGMRGNAGRIVDGNVVPSRGGDLGLRGLADIALQPGGGWLVGDGALALTTQNGGLVWQAPPAPLPDATRDICDFRSVCCRGEKVWIAGQPGSVVWHSPDAGRTWQKQRTGQPLPLASISFSSDESGWAAGALGTILRTGNGGRTWTIVRGAGRRLAVMTLHAHSRNAALNLVTRLSGELGYRSLVALLPREDIGPDGQSAADLDARLAEAVAIAGGSAAHIAWQFPLSVPGLDRDSEKLIADWNRRTENRLAQTMLGHLVRQLRMWRPSVLVIDQPPANDALSRLVNDAVTNAVEQAADPTRFLDHQELAGLSPWRVERVLVRLPPGSTGQIHLDPFEYLPRLGKSLQMASAEASSRLFPNADFQSLREAFRPLARAADDSPAPATDFFSGLHLPPGSAARRDLVPLDDADFDARLKITQRQRNFSALVDQNLADVRFAGQLIAQLPETVRGMTDAEAALQTARLAESYFANGHWELCELTLIELVERYPDQPASLRAMQWLFQFWGSAETTWRRVRMATTGQQRLKPNPRDTFQKVEQAAARLEQQAQDAANNGLPNLPAGGFGPIGGEQGAEFGGDSATYRRKAEERFRFWQDRAVQLARNLERREPALFATPGTQFPLAALYRQRSDHLKSDKVYRQHLLAGADSEWSQAAAGEVWLANPVQLPVKPMAVCRATAERPVLDGLLSDPCWQAAAELPLRATADEKPSAADHAFALLCHDDEYLYFAASVPRAPGTRSDGPRAAGRRYDEDLADFDRINLFLDVDRDYVTHYNLAVDQRGCTAEACWHDAHWNPRWFVAVDADKSHWRIEVAIPLEELVLHPPAAKTVWSVGIVRTIPAVGLESWTHPAASVPRPETFGLLRFEN